MNTWQSQLSLSSLDRNTPSAVNNINSVLECRVCDEVFSCQGQRTPRLLHCGHSICHRCLTKLPIADSAIKCPFDRQPTAVGDSCIWGLKKNFALLELLEKLQVADEAASNCDGRLDLPSAINVASFTAAGIIGLHFDPEKEKQLNILCDENESHLAVLYCTVCESHLCLECSTETHRTRVLARHARVPLSQKPKQRSKCPYHSAYALEFVCLEEDCSAESPLMCILCRDYGRHSKHRHSLLESEAEVLRNYVKEAVACFGRFTDQVMESQARVVGAIVQIEGHTDGLEASSVEDNGSLPPVSLVAGTADLARQQVRIHFAVLREVLHAQESAALTVVDIHVRERLDAFHHQEEEMRNLIAHLSSSCLQLEKLSAQDDTKIICGRKVIKNLIENLRNRQQQFSDCCLVENLETKIPISFTKDNRVHIGPKIEMRVVSLGLDGAGKSSILFRLRHNEVMSTQPTIGFNVETIEYKNLRMTIWDVGGHPKLRPLWKHYYSNTQALVFVVDSCDRDRLAEVQSELVKLLSERDLRDASLLLFANKQDVEGALTFEELIELLTLSKLCYGRSWHLQPCDAVTGRGLVDGLEWLSRQLVSASLTTEHEIAV